MITYCNVCLIFFKYQPSPSIPGGSRSSSLSSTTSSGESSNAGIGKLRRRFHDLLDDAFSLLHGQRASDRVTPLATPAPRRRHRTKSAAPVR